MKYTEAQKAAVKHLPGTHELNQRIRDDFLKTSQRVRIEKGFIVVDSSMNFKRKKKVKSIKSR